MRTSSVLVTTIALLTVACSGSGRTGRSNTPARGAVITAAELETTAQLDAYDAVRRLRPMWVRTRGPVSMTLPVGVQVYINGSRRGHIEELRSFRANEIESITYLSAPEATTRFGIGHSDGAVLVILKRGN